MKKEGRNYLLEMEFIKNWIITVMDFLEKKIPEFHKFSEVMKSTFDKYPNQNSKKMLQGYRESYRDINEMAKNLSLIDYNELDKILIERFGKGLNDVNNTKILEKIIKRGKIISDDEFRLIDEKVNELCQTEPQSSEVDMLNKLLLVYHEKRKKG